MKLLTPQVACWSRIYATYHATSHILQINSQVIKTLTLSARPKPFRDIRSFSVVLFMHSTANRANSWASCRSSVLGHPYKINTWINISQANGKKFQRRILNTTITRRRFHLSSQVFAFSAIFLTFSVKRAHSNRPGRPNRIGRLKLYSSNREDHMETLSPGTTEMMTQLLNRATVHSWNSVGKENSPHSR